jgi:RecA-family ATPase
LNADPPPPRFVLYPYIPVESVTVLAGPGASNKTTLTTYLAVCRALGLPFFGLPVPEGKTAILTTEDSREDYLRKLAALRVELGDAFDAKRIAERVTLFDLPGHPVRLVEAERGTYRPTAFADDLATVLHEKAPGADLLIMETVSRLAGGIETNESLSILVEATQRVCRLAGVATQLVAHVGQETARLGVADAYAPRGGSAMGDNGRSTMILTRITKANRKEYAPGIELTADDYERLRVLVHAKSNHARSAKPLLLECHATQHGPVLRAAMLGATAIDREANTQAQIERLCHVVAELTAQGVDVTERKLRPRKDQIGCTERELDPLLAEAVASGKLRIPDRRTRGGGTVYEVP